MYIAPEINIIMPTNNQSNVTKDAWNQFIEFLEEIKKQRFRELPVNTETPQEPIQPIQDVQSIQEEKKPLRPRIGVFSNPAYGKHAKVVNDGGTI